MGWKDAADYGLKGAGVGSAFGPIGAGVGGLLGGIYGGFQNNGPKNPLSNPTAGMNPMAGYGANQVVNGGGNWLTGTGSNINQLPNMTPQGMQFLEQFLSQAGMNQPGSLQQDQSYNQGRSALGDILGNDQGSFDRFAAPYTRYFNENILPGIKSSFGGQGNLDSSAYQNALNRGGESILQSLMSGRESQKMNAIAQALGYAQAPQQNYLQHAGLGVNARPFSYGVEQGQPGAIGDILETLGKLAPAYLDYKSKMNGTKVDTTQVGKP